MGAEKRGSLDWLPSFLGFAALFFCQLVLPGICASAFAISLGRMMTGKMMVQQSGLDIILPPIILPEFRCIRRARFPGERSLSLGTPGLHDERPIGLWGPCPTVLASPTEAGKFRGGFWRGNEDDPNREHGSLDPELVFVACRRARGAGGQA